MLFLSCGGSFAGLTGSLVFEIVAGPLVFVTVLWAVSAAFLPRAQRGTIGVHGSLFFLIILYFTMHKGQVPVCASVKPPRRGRAGFCGLQSVVVFI